MTNTQITTFAFDGKSNGYPECQDMNAGGRKKFLASDHGQERSLARQAVNKAFREGQFSRTERDVALAILNLWFHHRGAQMMGVIRPGRKYLAKHCGCCVRTVASVLKRLREANILLTIAYAKGGRRATQYRLDTHALMVWCGVKFPEVANGALKLLARPLKAAARVYQKRATSAHGNNNRSEVSNLPRSEVPFEPGNWWEDWGETSNV